MTQTVRTFDNGYAVLAGLGTSAVRDRDLTFRTRDGVTIACPNVPGARVPVYEVFAEDAYRMADLVDGLRADLVAVDIGAHIGCLTVALASRAPQAVVHAYEASPSTAEWLRRNVGGNDLAGRVTVHAEAVSDHEGVLQFADNARGSSLNGLTAPADTALVDVPTTTIAGAFAAAGGGVDLVKIDTEGAEYTMVLGSDPADWSTVSRVVLEYHDVAGHDWDELADFFTRAGLTVDRREPATPRQGTAWLSRRTV